MAQLAGTLASQLLEAWEDSSGVSVYLARAHYLAGNAWRLLGDPARAESAFAAVPYHFGPGFGSLDRAFYCRALALLRWEQGRLEEAEALFLRALHCFRETGQREEVGTTLALLALEDFERWEESRRLRLEVAFGLVPWERRPFLTVRLGLALALVFASQDAPDQALAMLVEMGRLAPQIRASEEHAHMDWWEGRVMARLGVDIVAAGLLSSAGGRYLKERRIAEAVLCSLDEMLVLGEAGLRAEVRELVDSLELRLRGEKGGEVAIAVARELRRDIESGRKSDLRSVVRAKASTLRQLLRRRGVHCDRLPFA
ncbi:MAG TPA: hypothetical protein VFC23_21665 [Thermoanaerobaculia bacterium]|nr:hypothetical protein [Thermoanaerobaculia bacterium]